MVVNIQLDREEYIMKKERKKLNPIFMFILGIIVTAGTVYAVTLIPANQVSYTNTTGYIDADNVQGAIEKVYASVVDYNSLKTERDKYYNIAILQGSNDKSIFKQNVNYTTLTQEFGFHGVEGSSSICTVDNNASYCSFTVSHNQGNGDSNGRWVSPIDMGDGNPYYLDEDATLVSHYCTYKTSALVVDVGATLRVTIFKDRMRLVSNGGTGNTTPDDSFCSAHAEQMFNKDAFTLSTTYLNNLELNDVTHTEN